MTDKNEKYKTGFILTLNNAKTQFDAAERLADNKFYGLAVSLLILSSEEAIKAFVIFAQHLFPKEKNKWHNKVFEDHTLKLNIIRTILFIKQIQLQMAESIYIPTLKNIDSTPENLKTIKKQGVQHMVEWLKKEKQSKRTELSLKMNWWKHAKALKEDGFYVRYDSQNWHHPDKIKKTTYNKARKYTIDLLQTIDNLNNINFNIEPFNTLFKIANEI